MFIFALFFMSNRFCRHSSQCHYLIRVLNACDRITADARRKKICIAVPVALRLRSRYSLYHLPVVDCMINSIVLDHHYDVIISFAFLHPRHTAHPSVKCLCHCISSLIPAVILRMHYSLRHICTLLWSKVYQLFNTLLRSYNDILIRSN